MNKKRFGAALIYLLVICLVLPVLSVSAEGEAVKINMVFIGDAKAGEEMKLKISVSKPASALAGLEFALAFDSELVTPTVTESGEDGKGLNALVTKMPSGWEQISTFSKSESKYYFRFAMPEDGTALNTKSAITLEIPFTVKSPGVITFTVADNEVIAIAADETFSLLSGKGTELSVVAAGSNEKFAVELGNTDIAPENGIYNLNISATNLGDNEGIIGLEFALNYDNKVFKPYITENDKAQMDEFMVSMPKDSWEQMCTLYEDENKLVLRFAALHAESITDSEKLLAGSSIKLNVPFLVIGREGDTAKFTVDSLTALGINNKTKKIVGRGDVKSMSVGKGISSLPAGLYDTEKGHLLYVAEKTTVSDFLKGLGSIYVKSEGEIITEGFIKSGYMLIDGSNSLTIVVKGDVNCNGEIDSMDYILTKRAYYGTFEPNVTQLFAMTFTGEDTPTSMDYLLLKRHYFGTYDINK